jgi:hypothetical protein
MVRDIEMVRDMKRHRLRHRIRIMEVVVVGGEVLIDPMLDRIVEAATIVEALIIIEAVKM